MSFPFILSSLNSDVCYLILILFVGFLTAFYMFKTYFMIFEGEYRGENEINIDVEQNKFFMIPLYLLFVPVCLFMILGLKI